ncbi:hypothetical protein DSO57_1039192, partial [Entomophthora muscae]
MKEIPSTPFFPNVTPSQDFSKLGPSPPPLWESNQTLVWAVTISHLPRQELTPIPPSEPSPEQIPALSTGSEESYGSITEHRYYNSASYEEPTKKKYSTKNPPR